MDVEATAQKWISNMNLKKLMDRPRTADKQQGPTSLGSSVSLASSRPLTAASGVNHLSTSTMLASLRAELDKPDVYKVANLTSTIPHIENTEILAGSVKLLNAKFSQGSESQESTAALSLATSNKIASHSNFLCNNDLIRCRYLTLNIESTWGDKDYAGLTGIEILVGLACTPVKLDSSCIDVSSPELMLNNPRTPDKLLDGINDTTDEFHMWITPFIKGADHRITFDLGFVQDVSGMRIWNYNKSPEGVLRGARVLSIRADDKFVGKFVARIGPGCDGVNFGQRILFRELALFHLPNRVKGVPTALSYSAPKVKQTFETLNLPSGMLWKITIYSNWGDSYYVGLDGIEFLNEKGDVVAISPSRNFGTGEFLSLDMSSVSAIIDAVPNSVNDLVLSGVSNEDKRIPLNLHQGSRNRDLKAGGCSWLAPLARCMSKSERRKRGLDLLHYQKGNIGKDVIESERDFNYYPDNVLYIMFDRPLSVSCIRLVTVRIGYA